MRSHAKLGPLVKSVFLKINTPCTLKSLEPYSSITIYFTQTGSKLYIIIILNLMNLTRLLIRYFEFFNVYFAFHLYKRKYIHFTWGMNFNSFIVLDFNWKFIPCFPFIPILIQRLLLIKIYIYTWCIKDFLYRKLFCQQPFFF